MIQILEGPSGSGKTTGLYKRLIDAAVAQPERRFYLLVPEQFTMQAQRDMVTIHPDGGTMNIDVVSFNRLALKIFEECNLTLDHILEDFGKSMLLKKILMEHEKEFPIFAACHQQSGFLDELKSLLTEFFQYRIGEEELESFTGALDAGDPLQEKMRELLLLYRIFLQELEGHYIIAEHILETLCDVIPRSGLLADAGLWFDGFTGFTPIQYEVIETMMRNGNDMTFTVTMDRESAEAEQLAEHELFYLSKTTVGRILELADACGQGAEEVFFGEGCPRFGEHASLMHLEQHLFRYPSVPMEGTPEEVKLHVMRSPRSEVSHVARQIRRLVREEGYRYRDIAVIHGDLQGVEPYVEEAFGALNIPYFIDVNTPILMNPCMETLRGLMDVAVTNYSYESVFRLLKAGLLFPRETEELLEQLDNVVLARGIRGKSWWEKYFQGEDELHSYAREVLEKLSTYTDAFKEAKQVEDYVRVLRSFIENEKIYESLEELVESYGSAELTEVRQPFHQTQTKIEEVLAKLENVLPEAEVSTEEFQELLETGLGCLVIGRIPMGLDYVVVGDLERSRLNHVKVLFVLGLNDGTIPRMPSAAGILSAADRKTLSKLNPKVEFAPDVRTRVFTEQFYLYQNLTKPEDLLMLSYHLQDGEGKEVLPSYVIDRIEKLFPEMHTTEISDTDIDLEKVETREDASEILAKGLQEDELSEAQQSIWRMIYDSNKVGDSEQIKRLREGITYRNRIENLPADLIRALYGDELKFSISRLENYARCPYQYFLKYGLRLQPRNQYEVSIMEVGTLMHSVVEEVFGKIETREPQRMSPEELQSIPNPWESVTEAQIAKLVHEAIGHGLEKKTDARLEDNLTNKSYLKRIEDACVYSLTDLKNQVLAGGMIPYKFEAGFNTWDAEPGFTDLQSARIELHDGMQVELQGVVDRVDVALTEDHVYVKVVDYKSSGKTISLDKLAAGVQLQLWVYTGVMLDALGHAFGDRTPIPSGALYYTLQERGVDVKNLAEAEDAEKLRAELAKASRMTGIININAPNPELMGGEDVLLLPKKNPEAKENIITEGQYYSLLDFAEEVMTAAGDAMMEGKISNCPIKDGNSLPCAYCDYRQVCRFDGEDGGNVVRSLKAAALAEIPEDCLPQAEEDGEEV